MLNLHRSYEPQIHEFFQGVTDTFVPYFGLTREEEKEPVQEENAEESITKSYYNINIFLLNFLILHYIYTECYRIPNLKGGGFALQFFKRINIISDIILILNSYIPIKQCQLTFN